MAYASSASLLDRQHGRSSRFTTRGVNDVETRRLVVVVVRREEQTENIGDIRRERVLSLRMSKPRSKCESNGSRLSNGSQFEEFR